MSSFFFSPAIININIFFHKMTSCPMRQFSAFCGINILAETHHVDSSRLVHGAHGHEGGQPNGGAMERHAPAGRNKRRSLRSGQPSWRSLALLTLPDHSQGEKPRYSRPVGQLPGHHTSHFLSPTLSLLQRNGGSKRSLLPTICPEPHSLEGNGQGSQSCIPFLLQRKRSGGGAEERVAQVLMLI